MATTTNTTAEQLAELVAERDYWRRLQQVAWQRDGLEPRSDCGIGACLAETEREIAALTVAGAEIHYANA
jgi:hypothetical protein